ncbi:hypothetical protein F383_22148 [Gossypium arboreum]|uniref:Uncharacterized protein n=1 Tax=Gossypium arboreum TaxID=29729 RepID=A0A0B0NNG1_GOSAR|nr:hypothetical protein F383_22148 [Gossypium arboreum]
MFAYLWSKTIATKFSSSFRVNSIYQPIKPACIVYVSRSFIFLFLKYLGLTLVFDISLDIVWGYSPSLQIYGKAYAKLNISVLLTYPYLTLTPV